MKMSNFFSSKSGECCIVDLPNTYQYREGVGMTADILSFGVIFIEAFVQFLNSN